MYGLGEFMYGLGEFIMVCWLDAMDEWGEFIMVCWLDVMDGLGEFGGDNNCVLNCVFANGSG